MERPAEDVARDSLKPVLRGLKPDSVVWIHNRPDYASAIETEVRAAGARLVLHLHNSLRSYVSSHGQRLVAG